MSVTPQAGATSDQTACCCDREHLTTREIEILCAVAAGYTNVAAGYTNKEIAKKLNISEHAVHRHMTAMLHRTDARSRTGLVSQTYRSGILVMGNDGPAWNGRRCLNPDGACEGE